MAKQTIDIGSSANDGTGDTLRAAGNKINQNFSELYGTVGLGITTVSSGEGISVSRSGNQIVITNTMPSRTNLPYVFPSITTSDRDELTAQAGMVLFNTTVSKLQVYNGTAWVDLH